MLFGPIQKQNKSGRNKRGVEEEVEHADDEEAVVVLVSKKIAAEQIFRSKKWLSYRFFDLKRGSLAILGHKSGKLTDFVT